MTSDENINWRDPVVLGIAGCFVVESSLNAIAGFELIGGGGKGLLFAFGGVLLAFLGAWVGKEAVGLFRAGSWRIVFAMLMLSVSAACCGLSLVASWRALGVSFADTAKQRELSATQGSVAADKLSAKREARAKLGVQPASATLQQQISAELSTYLRGAGDSVGKVTKDCAEVSLAPATCKRVNGLKVQLTQAVQAEKLDEEIETASKGMVGKPVATPGSENMIFGSLTGASQRQGLMIAIVAFTVLVNFFANFGFAILALVRGELSGSPGPGGGDYGYEDGGPIYGRNHPYQPRIEHTGHRMMLPAPERAPAGGPASANAHSAPVTINIGGQAFDIPAKFVRGEPELEAMRKSADDARKVADTAQAQRDAAAARHDLPALPGDFPVDRSRVPADLDIASREAADVMLSFRAACVVTAPGGLVSLDSLFKRYRAWAGDRAVTSEAFADLFPRVTGIEVAAIGGFLHARGVAMRVAPALRAA